MASHRPAFGSLRRIRLYPIKSLDPIEVTSATVSACGALRDDRAYVLVDAAGTVMRAKQYPAMHRVRSSYDLDQRLITLWQDGGAAVMHHLDEEQDAIAAWLSVALDVPVRFVGVGEQNLPDDGQLLGPTVVGTATLRAAAQWMNVSDEEAAWRFRANLEVECDAPFGEEVLVQDDAAMATAFSIGEVRMLGVALCDRCQVPARDSHTGEEDRRFGKAFSQWRQEHMPAWAPRGRFDHHYYLTVRTTLVTAEAGKTLRVGDRVEVQGAAAHPFAGVPRRRYSQRVADVLGSG